MAIYDLENKLNMRHEYKYVLGPGEYMSLRQRCRLVMQRDPHVGPDGTYRIESLYFDDAEDSALEANKAGVSQRQKFRIRQYNGDHRNIHLEKKVKSGGLGTKFSCEITADELAKLCCGELDWMRDDPRGLVKELYVHMTAEGLCPKTIVSYRREPYIYGPGNVRVTFDSDIRTGVFSTAMLDGNTPLVPAAPGTVLMEVKYDRFLPDIISDIVQEDTLRVSAFSKYATCRQYDI